MKKIIIIWSISIFIILILGIKYLVNGSSESSNLLFEIFLVQILFLLFFFILKKNTNRKFNFKKYKSSLYLKQKLDLYFCY